MAFPRISVLLKGGLVRMLSGYPVPAADAREV
jgi:hypothetical protein